MSLHANSNICISSASVSIDWFFFSLLWMCYIFLLIWMDTRYHEFYIVMYCMFSISVFLALFWIQITKKLFSLSGSCLWDFLDHSIAQPTVNYFPFLRPKKKKKKAFLICFYPISQEWPFPAWPVETGTVPALVGWGLAIITSVMGCSFPSLGNFAYLYDPIGIQGNTQQRPSANLQSSFSLEPQGIPGICLGSFPCTMDCQLSLENKLGYR